ncbi:sulfotransferase family protein [Phytomonospora endophytica]|uniref:Sulfotransferase n=1 Tax=Phytomonospora endophytica TaxID=714109 RepID=A0A841FLF0_9ACTN|nr:sulfotransferase [Phytomonospora endophytica]MBB6034372.1 hypothetical protein [Phytomonospora endophytica]GIG66765.1 hypothetical protein Pen01_30600 [Phytomonospora endophytica]
MRPTTFIVGTGRSGSSALSRILNAHPEILSLNEMLAALTPVALPEGEVPGTEFWAILSGPNGIFDLMIRSDAALPEFLYPRKPGRHSAENGIPALCLMTLPPLTADPDAALDALEPIVTEWPTRPVGEHYAALFDHLTARFGGEVVVERSGYSVSWIPRLREVFPECRFVHLFRDGPDCAMSMSRHPGYRMIYHLRLMVEILGLDSITELDADQVAKLPPELAGLFADPFDRRLLMDDDVPPANFGRLWSEIVTEGVESLRGLPPERVMTLTYEDLIATPERELARLAEFAGAAADPSWIAHGAANLDASRRGAALRLPPKELTALREACAPGEAALARG